MSRLSSTPFFMLVTLLCGTCFAEARADKASSSKDQAGGKPRVKRVLLLSQGPDGHPFSTHEYVQGIHILAKCIIPSQHLQIVIAKADEPWNEGPQLIDTADGVVLFLSQGAKWLHQDPARLAAFRKLAERGGGFVSLHWAMGCQKAKYIDEYVKLFGGCHGGPDRKYKVVTVQMEIARRDHPILRGIGPFGVRDEFYYRLKFAKPPGSVTPLIRVPIDGENHTVAWSWERPDGGRSFGFSGGHFHKNWRLPEYRRLAAQAVLWTLKEPVPEKGLPVTISEKDLQLSRRKKNKQ